MIEYFSEFLFAIPIQFGITVFFIVMCTINFKKLEDAKILLLYALASICQSIFGIYISIDRHTEEEISLVHNSINVFMLLEFIIFCLFIQRSLVMKITKRANKIILVSFVLFIIYDWSTTDSFDKLPSFLTLIESYLMIPACFLYYFELFYSPPKTDFFRNHRFWIITGIFILFSLLVPIFLQRKIVYRGRLEIYNTIYLITFFAYITLFSFFIIGIRWKIRN